MANNAPTSALQHTRPAGGRHPGQPTLCLHCSTGSSKQWRSLAARLGEGRRIIAPDLLGYGDNPAWPRNRSLRLEDEVRRLLPLLACAPCPVDVVAHSFGAAVAVKLALEHPDKVRSLCLYEPVLLELLREDGGSSAALSEILVMSVKVGRCLSDGDADRAAARSPAVTRRIADLLVVTFPRVQSERFEQAGHMGPLTHARTVDASIERFVRFLPQQASHRGDAAPYTSFTARAA